jgi:hypothetical protein
MLDIIQDSLRIFVNMNIDSSYVLYFKGYQDQHFYFRRVVNDTRAILYKFKSIFMKRTWSQPLPSEDIFASTTDLFAVFL